MLVCRCDIHVPVTGNGHKKFHVCNGVMEFPVMPAVGNEIAMRLDGEGDHFFGVVRKIQIRGYQIGEDKEEDDPRRWSPINIDIEIVENNIMSVDEIHSALDESKLWDYHSEALLDTWDPD